MDGSGRNHWPGLSLRPVGGGRAAAAPARRHSVRPGRPSVGAVVRVRRYPPAASGGGSPSRDPSCDPSSEPGPCHVFSGSLARPAAPRPPKLAAAGKRPGPPVDSEARPGSMICGEHRAGFAPTPSAGWAGGPADFENSNRISNFFETPTPSAQGRLLAPLRACRAADGPAPRALRVPACLLSARTKRRGPNGRPDTPGAGLATAVPRSQGQDRRLGHAFSSRQRQRHGPGGCCGGGRKPRPESGNLNAGGGRGVPDGGTATRRTELRGRGSNWHLGRCGVGWGGGASLYAGRSLSAPSMSVNPSQSIRVSPSELVHPSQSI